MTLYNLIFQKIDFMQRIKINPPKFLFIKILVGKVFSLIANDS